MFSKCFLAFSGVLKWEHYPEIGYGTLSRYNIFLKHYKVYLGPDFTVIRVWDDSQQTHQRWNNVDRQRSSTLFRRWYLVENESWADAHLSTFFQRWQNNVETTSIELYRFNVDKTTLFQRWNLVKNESWADVCLSTLFQRW